MSDRLLHFPAQPTCLDQLRPIEHMTWPLFSELSLTAVALQRVSWTISAVPFKFNGSIYLKGHLKSWWDENHPQVCKRGRKKTRMSLLVKGVFVVFTPTSVWDQQQWPLAHWGHCWKVSSSGFHLQWPLRWSCFRNPSSRYSYEPSLLPVLQESSAGCLSKSPAQLCHSLCLCRHCKHRTHHWTDTQHREGCAHVHRVGP